MIDTIEVEEIAHSKLGASSADRWMNCAGSVQLIEKMLADLGYEERGQLMSAGYAASEGSAAHEIAAKALQGGQEAWEFAGVKVMSDGIEFVVDAEMAEGVQLHINLIQELMAEYSELGARLYVENSMSSVLDPAAFGTSDVVIYVPGVKLIVVDFKYGKGICVEPDSAQNKYYGYLGIENFDCIDIEEVELWITQPRIPHPKGKARKFVTTKTEVETWFKHEVVPAMQATREPDAPLTVGDWCRFCPAAKNNSCPALKRESENVDLTLDPVYMTDEQLGHELTIAKQLEKRLENLKAEAFGRARSGSKVPGWKLVKKKSVRLFKSGGEEAIAKALGSDVAYTAPVFKSPAQIEKIAGGKRLVARWAFSKDTGLTLAPESDKKDEVIISGTAYFGDL